MNLVILTGFVGNEPSLTESGTGQSILRFNLATRRNKSKEPDWHRCVMYGNYAKKMNERIKKGVRLAINGRIKYSKVIVNKQQCFFTDILVNNVEVLQYSQFEEDTEEKEQEDFF